MFILRLISFAARVIGAFVFVMLLQIPFGGKTMEQRLISFGKKWTLAKMLNQTAKDGAMAVSGEGRRQAAENSDLAAPLESSEAVRQLSGAIAPAARGFLGKIKGWLASDEAAPPSGPAPGISGEDPPAGAPQLPQE